MKVRITKDVNGSERIYKEGEIVEINDSWANNLIEIGKAEKYEQKEEKAVYSTKEKKFKEPKTKTDIEQPTNDLE